MDKKAMRIPLRGSWRAFLRAGVLATALLSCSVEPSLRECFPEGEEEGAVLTLTLLSPGDGDTKSVIAGGELWENQVRDVIYYIVSDGGQWKRLDGDGSTPLVASVRVSPKTGYTVYAFVNIPSSRIGGFDGRPVSEEEICYSLPESYASIGVTGMPMAGRAIIPAGALSRGGSYPVGIAVRRLLARIDVTIDKGGMLSGASGGEALPSELVQLRHVARVVRPFARGGSRARSDSELISDATDLSSDYYTFPIAERDALQGSALSFYVPENCQGVLSRVTSETQKNPLTAPSHAALATYLEYRARKDGSADGVSGDLTYRVYLGGDNAGDFNVEGNRVYRATLALTWDGLWSGDWRVSGGSWSPTDRRRLVIAEAADSFTPMGSTPLRVRKSSPTSFFTNYSVDGGATPAHGRMLQRDWPYGYEVLLDGEPLPASSGTLTGEGLSWSYAPATDCLELRSLAGAPSGVTHTLRMRSVDGRTYSNEVTFTAEIPFTGSWASGAPVYVTQNGLLKCIDPDTGAVSPEGVFHLTDPSMASRVRLTDNGDGTARVALLQPFTGEGVSVYMTDGEGNRRSEPVVIDRGLLPHFECTDLWTTYVDACASMRFVYYGCREDGSRSDEPLRVTNPSDPTYTGVGDQLDGALVESLIAPAASSLKGKLGFSRRLMEDGSYSLTAHIATYHGLSPSGKSFEVDEASVGMEGQDGVRPPHRTTFTAWNPWKNIGEPVQGRLMTDYTLYCEPNYLGDCTGWSPTPRYQPTDERVNTMTVQSIVVANGDNLSLNARFTTNELLGSKVFSGTPSTVSPEFSASSYTLRLAVARPQMDGASRAALLGYLRGRGCRFTDEADMMDYLGRCGDALVIGDSFASSGAAWAAAAPGTDRSTGSWLDGVSFSVRANAALRQWTLTYSMKGLTREDLSTHGAGKLALRVNVRNPYDGSLLEKEVGSAYMRLFIFAWPIIYGPYPYSPGSDVQRGTFGMGLYAPVTNVTSALRDLLGSGYSMGMFIARAERELWFNAANYTSTLCGESETYISTKESTSAEAGWYLPEDWDYLASYPKSAFKDVLSHGMQFPFYFKSQAELNALRGNSFFRESDYRIYYDPSGSVKTYSYGEEGFNIEQKGKLFVIELGAQDSFSYAKEVYFTSDYR